MTRSQPPDYWYYQEEEPDKPGGWLEWLNAHRPLVLGAVLFIVVIALANAFWQPSSVVSPVSTVPPGAAVKSQVPDVGTSEAPCGLNGVGDSAKDSNAVDFGGVRYLTISCAQGTYRVKQVFIDGAWKSQSATPNGVAPQQ